MPNILEILLWAKQATDAAAIIGFLGIFLFIGYRNFIHLLPAYFALVLYFVGLVTTYPFFNKLKDKLGRNFNEN